MKKFSKLFLSLLLAGSVTLNSLSVFAEEEASEDEATEQVEEENQVETQYTPVENPEEIIKELHEANQEPTSKQMRGIYSFDFEKDGEKANFTNAEYSLTYKLDPSFSAEIDFNYVSPGAEAPERLFAYIHNGQFLQYTNEEWHKDDFSGMEEIVVSLLTSKDEDDFYANHFDLFETETSYILKLKEDLDSKAFYEAVNKKFDFDSLKETLKSTLPQEASDYHKVIDGLFTPEKFEEIIANGLRVDLLFEKESKRLVNNFISAAIPFADLYEAIGKAEGAPEILNILFEQNNGKFGEDFDFSFLDEVAPAE